MTTGDRPARSERTALCDLALELGPDAPTLCSPWTVAELLAHLAIREGRPDLAPGIWVSVPFLERRLERAQADLAASDFTALVERVRTGPPLWSPTRLSAVDDAVNLFEFFVHHEDVRRANGSGPRVADPALDRALAGALHRAAPLFFRRSKVGVRVAAEHGREYAAHGPTSLGSVTLRGPVEEIVLYAYGRRGVVRGLDVDGTPEAVAALEGSRLGI